MGTKVNIVIDQGTDFATTVSLTNAEGAQLDLTGMSAASQIRKTYSSSNSTAFTTALANNNGTLTLSLNNSVTSCLLYTSPSPRDLSTSRMPSSA